VVSSRRREVLVLALAGLASAGCDKWPGTRSSPFNSVDITGADLGPDFRLSDHDGKERTLADFRGKAVAIFFGYTQCPDVCPTTLAEMAHALKLLGPDGARVQVLFITVDPKRDTPDLLRHYVPAFHPSFIGLRGDEAARLPKPTRSTIRRRPSSSTRMAGCACSCPTGRQATGSHRT
jgi:protein SCO1